MTTEILTLREQVEAEIKSHLDNIASSYMLVGNALLDIRGDFDNQKEFLAWVNDEFGIKKSQCYNLMKLSETFGDHEALKGISMRVLLILQPFADNTDIMDKAVNLYADGKLDTKSANELVSPSKPPVITTESFDKEELLDNKPSEVIVQHNDRVVTIPPIMTAPYGVSEEEQVNKLEDTQGAEMKALLSQLKSQSETINLLNERVAELTSVRESKKASAIMLPQFTSSCMYARLGLSLEESQDKAKVNKAKRDLVKLGYGEGHEAWTLIQHAVSFLLS